MSARADIRDADVDTKAIAQYEAARRDAVRSGLAAGATVLSAAMVPTLLRVRNAFAQADGDAAVVSDAIRLENTAVAAYDAAIVSKRLDASTTAVARRFRRDESEHARALTAALRNLGGTPPRGRDEPVLEPLADARNRGDVLRFAVELETMAVAAYYEALGRLREAKLLQTCASIMANEGQHLVVLRQALGHNPFPAAFETGQKVS